MLEWSSAWYVHTIVRIFSRQAVGHLPQHVHFVTLCEWSAILLFLGACLRAETRENYTDYHAQYLEAREAKKRIAQNYLSRTTQQHLYAMRYFDEMVFSEVQRLANCTLPKFADLLVKVKAASELEEYRWGMFIDRGVSREQKWKILPPWLATSDEYRLLKDENMVKRLHLLAQAIRSSPGAHPGVSTGLIVDCFVRDSAQLSNLLRILRIAPHACDLSHVYEDYRTVAKTKTNMAKYCLFQLASILEEIPLTKDEEERYAAALTNVTHHDFDAPPWFGQVSAGTSASTFPRHANDANA